MSNLAGPLAQVDPQAVASYVEQMPKGGGTRMMALSQVAANWAEVDPQADLAWLQSIPNTTRTPMMIDAVNDWANSDPAAATAYAQSLPHDDPVYEKMISALAKNQAGVDVNTAMSWAQSLPADSGRDSATSAVIAKLSAEDPAAAAAALQTLTPGSAPDATIMSIAVDWANEDPVAAGQWVANLPSGTSHDNAARQYITSQLQTDAPDSFNVALSIGNATVKSNQLNRVVQQWAKTDPAAATAAVQSAKISDDIRTRLLGDLPSAAPVTPAAVGN